MRSYMTNFMLRFFSPDWKKVIKRKRIYWFGTFPWNKWHKMSAYTQKQTHVERKTKRVEWKDSSSLKRISLWYTAYRMCTGFAFSASKNIRNDSCCMISNSLRLEVAHIRLLSFCPKDKTMLMSTKNIHYELFWHLILFSAKNML